MSLRVVRNHALLVAAIGLIPGIMWQPLVAQTIVPTGDTGTQVIRNGDRLEIQGGAVSGDGRNLFHTFEQFNVLTGETANFLSAPQIQNILGQVVGGNASIINGILQVTGSNANLFLLNPAGIVFGPHATLNVPGAFTATTANGVGFAGGWFSGTTNDYQALVGSPNSFIFATKQPGILFNAGNLAVGDRQSLNLIGGMTINTGSLSAPGGQITIAAVPAARENLVLVRINQSGMLLSLDILPPNQNPLANSAINLINPLTLPELLTGGKISDATNVRINPDGTVSLTGSPVRVSPEPGTAIVSGQVSVSTPQGTGGSVTIVGDKIGVIGTQIEAAGSLGGGDVRIGGDYQGNGPLPTAARTLVSNDAMIRADASSGNGGRVIVWADELTGFYGQISARGGENFGNGGLVEVSGKENLIFNGRVDVTAPQGVWGTLLLDPWKITISNEADSKPGLENDFLNTLQSIPGNEDITISVATLQKQSGQILIKATHEIEILDDISLTFNPPGSITFTAEDKITIAPGVSLTFNAASSVAFIADSDNKMGGAFSMDPTQSITARGANLTISGAGITLGKIDTSATGQNNAGSITLRANSGNITTGALDAGAASGNAGDINIDAPNGLVNITGYVSSNNLTVRGTEIDFSGGPNSVGRGQNRGERILTLKPGQDEQDVALGLSPDNTGANNTPALDISEEDLKAIAPGFQEMIIGDPNTDGTGKITLGAAASFPAPVQIQGGSVLVLQNPESTWEKDAENNGTVSNPEVSFFRIENVEGGKNRDSSGNNNSANNNAGNNNSANNNSGNNGSDDSNNNANKPGVPVGAAPAQESPPLDLQFVLEQDANDSPETPGSASRTQVAEVRPATTIVSPSTAVSPTPPVATSVASIVETTKTPPVSPPTTASPVVSPTNPENGTSVVTPVQAIAPVPSATTATTTPPPPPAPVPSATTATTTPPPPATQASAPVPSAPVPVVETNNPASNVLNQVNIPEPTIPQSTNPADFNFNPASEIDPIYPFTHSREAQLSIDSSLSLNLQAPRLDLSSRQELEQLINSGQLEPAVEMGDRLFTEEFWDYLRSDLTRSYLSFPNMQIQLQQIAKTTEKQTAIVYVFTRENQLDLIIVPPVGRPIYKNVAIDSRAAFLEKVEEFQTQITDPIYRQTTTYLPLAQELYQLIISPLEEELEKLNTDTLIFSVDAGLRTLPWAALNDGEKFLVEKYSLSLTPSVHLLDPRHQDIHNSRVLAMGISEFPDKNPLPAVPVELQTIAQKWSVETIFGQSATLENLRRFRAKINPSIIHIATHAQFKSGQLHNSYIQLSDQPLHLDQIPRLNWNQPPVELLVLSACRTAIGDQETEYGFAGLAVQAGVKSALASLWYANDAATLGLMSEFYAHLRSTPIKAEGLRQAQIAMIRGELSLTDGFLVGTFGKVELPPALKELGNLNLNHPYYWSGFTMIGSPW